MTHQLIRIIGVADTQQAAHESALEFADQLVEDGEFDYYLDQPVHYPEAGSTFQLTHELGRFAVQEALKANRETFDRALETIRRMFSDFTDEQIYQEDFGRGDDAPDYYASRYQFGTLAGDNHATYIYGDDTVWGEPIKNDREYLLAIGDLDPNEVWVTLLDMHH